MHDSRLEKLADVLTTHSTKVQPGEFVLIEGVRYSRRDDHRFNPRSAWGWRHTTRRD